MIELDFPPFKNSTNTYNLFMVATERSVHRFGPYLHNSIHLLGPVQSIDNSQYSITLTATYAEEIFEFRKAFSWTSQNRSPYTALSLLSLASYWIQLLEVQLTEFPALHHWKRHSAHPRHTEQKLCCKGVRPQLWYWKISHTLCNQDDLLVWHLDGNQENFWQ